MPSVQTAQVPHGAGGLFTTPGVEPGIVSTMVQPSGGLYGFLQRLGLVRTSKFENPLYEILTGQKASTGTEPTVSCAPGKQAGPLKLIHVSWPFGRFTRSSGIVDLSQAGALRNRSEDIPRQFLNNPFSNLPSVGVNVSPNDLFLNRQAMALIGTLNAIERDYRPLLFTGNPANTAGSAGYIEFNGLQKMINTGYKSVLTGTASPSVDPLLVDMANANIQASGAMFVAALVEALDFVRHLAEQVGLRDTEWAFVGSRGAFRALTEIWACTYQSYRCAPTNTATTNVNINATDAANLMMAMRAGNYLMIDGMEVPFIVDDTTPETSVGGGVFADDIYLLPYRSPALTDTGGAALFLEYFDFNAPGAVGDIVSSGLLGDAARAECRVSGDGRYLVNFAAADVWCKQLHVLTKYRLIQRLPFLSARFQNVRYTVRFHERQGIPGQPYFTNGGDIYGTPFTTLYGQPV